MGGDVSDDPSDGARQYLRLRTVDMAKHVLETRKYRKQAEARDRAADTSAAGSAGTTKQEETR